MNPTELKIIQAIHQLTELQKLRLLDFIEAFLQINQPPKPTQSLLKFAGSIPLEDVFLMESAIQEDCNKIDHNEW